MSLPTTNVEVGERRIDPADGLTYTFNASGAWVLAVSPSSSGFPTTGNKTGDIREHVASGRKYRWTGSAWAIIAEKDLDANQDGVPDKAGTVEDNAITQAKMADNAITQAKMADDAVGKAELKYEVKTVQIDAAASGTATVVAGSEILGFNVTAITGTEHVKTIDISSTTLTVTLTGSDTATVKVVVLLA
jgi:hypothetical protein